MCPPTISVRPSASCTWPAAEEVAPVRNRREDARLRIPEPLGVERRVEAVEREDLAGRLERHVHGDDRPRERRTPLTDRARADRRAPRSSRRAERAPRAPRASRARCAATTESRARAVGVFAAFAPHSSIPPAFRCRELCYRGRSASADNGRKFRPAYPCVGVRRDRRAARASEPSRCPRRPRDTLGQRARCPHAAIGTKTSSSRKALNTGAART